MTPEAVDIIFPRNVGPLSYSVPDALAGQIAPGVAVTAEVRKTMLTGIVAGPSTAPADARLKPIARIDTDTPQLSDAMIRLARWIAEYYVSTDGMALKSVLPPEFFRKVKRRASTRAAKQKSPPAAPPPVEVDEAALSEIRNAAGYRAFLLHAPAVNYEAAFVARAVEGRTGVIVAAPEMSAVARMSAALRPVFGDRLCLYHSAMSAGERRAAIEKIASGGADAVLGSMSAVFAPLPRVSMIAVMHEESGLYKSESGPRVSARDAAVMRAHIEGAAVLLSSVCPSVESYHNAATGKYALIDMASKTVRPEVRVLGPSKERAALHPALRRMAESKLASGRRVMIVVSRRGYSALVCAECGAFVECPSCGSAAEYFKTDKALRCARCGTESRPPRACPRCKGRSLEPLGAGLERIDEELRALAPRGAASTRDALQVLTEDPDGRLLVGTRAIARVDELAGRFALVGVINADAYRYQADYRATERAFQELVYASGKLEPNGKLMIQCRDTRAGLFRYLKGFGFHRFYDDEFRSRRDAGYPPFQRLALVTVASEAEPPAIALEGAEALGPLRWLRRARDGGSVTWRYIIKAVTRQTRERAVREALRALAPLETTVDVDPYYT